MWRGSIDIMQISGHTNVAFINNYSTLSEERHKKISNILSNTESETNRNAFQQSCEFEPRSWRGVLDTTVCEKACQ